MRTFVCLIAVALLGAVSCQDQSNNTVPNAGAFPFPYPFDPSAAAGNPLLNAVYAIQSQQYASDRYRSVILDVQSAQGWMQVSQGWLALEARQNGDAEDESSVSIDDIERNAEMALLYVLKLMYIQAANKLHDSHQSHYKTKVQLSILQGMGAGNTGLAPILTLMYYLETLRVMSSAITIQRQDAWNTWLLHEIMETDEFDNSRSGLPEEFAATMKHSRLIAMQLYYQEAQIDLQKMYLEYMLQMYIGQVSGQPQGNAAAAASFLEEESTAEPSKPFLPMMMMGMYGPQYFSYMSLYLRYFSAIMNMQAAHGLMTHAFMDIHSESTNGEDMSKYSQMNKVSALQALHQWAYLRQMQAMLDMYSMFYSFGSGAQQPQMAANSLLQTEPASSPVNQSA